MMELTHDIYIISRLTHIYYARELKKFDLTMGQFPFIMGISGQDGISQEKLSQTLRISKSTTTAIIRQLLNKGFATRETDPEDRRNFKLHLTAKARELIPKIRNTIQRCHGTIAAGLTPVEKNVLAELVRRVRLNSENDLLS